LSASITHLSLATGVRRQKQRSDIDEELFAEARAALSGDGRINDWRISVASHTRRGADIFDIRFDARSVSRGFLCASEDVQDDMWQAALEWAQDDIEPVESWPWLARATIGGGTRYFVPVPNWRWNAARSSSASPGRYCDD
jgi:hypothetical protein